MRHAVPLILATAVTTLACGGAFDEPQADVSSLQTFDGDGLTFQYPGNWSVTREAEAMEGGELVSITAESPGNALVIVQLFPSAVEVDLDAMATLIAGSMQAAVAEVSGGTMDVRPPVFEDHPASFGGVERPGRRATWSVALLGVDVPHTMDVHLIQREAGDIVVVTQVPDEDRAQAEPGFEVVRSSFTPANSVVPRAVPRNSPASPGERWNSPAPPGERRN